MSYSFDTSSLIHLWDNYPITNPHFKTLWETLSQKFESGLFTISDIALKEFKDKIPDFGKELGKRIHHFEKGFEITLKAESQSIEDLITARNFKEKLDIKGEKYGSGVGKNDLLIIAVAKRNHRTLVSEEAKQPKLPKEKPKYKIPAVCKEIAEIPCMNIQELLWDNIL